VSEAYPNWSPKVPVGQLVHPDDDDDVGFDDDDDDDDDNDDLLKYSLWEIIWSN
jgi:hypothetical protein